MKSVSSEVIINYASPLVSRLLTVWSRIMLILCTYLLCILQTMSNQASRLTQMSSQIRDLESSCDRRQRKLAQVEETLMQERSKVQQLEAELATLDIVKEGLGNELDKVNTKINYSNQILSFITR